MARVAKIICDSCGTTRIDAGKSFCGGCDRPTRWATHQERVDWEVRQWRKARSASNGDATVSVLARPAEPTTPPEEPDGLDGFLLSSDPKPRPKRKRPTRPAFLTRLIAVVRRLFDGSMMVPLDPKPEPAPQAPARMQLVRVEEAAVSRPEPVPQPEATPEPVAIAQPKPPAKPRKRPNPPTNKDMLKQALSVLGKVEQRLEQLEQELAGIDDAVRKVVPNANDDEPPAAVGE